MNAPRAENLALDEVIEPVAKTVTPVSEAVAVCQLTETAIPQVADGDNTAGSDKVKGPRV